MSTVTLPRAVVEKLLEYAKDGVVHQHRDPHCTDGTVLVCDMCDGQHEHDPDCAIGIAEAALRTPS